MAAISQERMAQICGKHIIIEAVRDPVPNLVRFQWKMRCILEGMENEKIELYVNTSFADFKVDLSEEDFLPEYPEYDTAIVLIDGRTFSGKMFIDMDVWGYTELEIIACDNPLYYS